MMEVFKYPAQKYFDGHTTSTSTHNTYAFLYYAAPKYVYLLCAVYNVYQGLFNEVLELVYTWRELVGLWQRWS